jgi:hypothetical protein
MPIEIEIRTSEEEPDVFSIDGHYFKTTTGIVKKIDIYNMLEHLGYITVKVIEE